MDECQFIERAQRILFHMALENTGWRKFFRRWYISDEPLRNDAARLIHDWGYLQMQPNTTRIYKP